MPATDPRPATTHRTTDTDREQVTAMERSGAVPPPQHGGETPGTASGYHVEVLPGVDSLPRSVWTDLAPADDPMWSRDLFTAMERGSIGPDGYACLVVRRGPDVAAVLPLVLFRELRLDHIVGARERRFLTPVRRLFPRLLRVPTLLCGNLLGQGHVLTASPLRDDVSRLLVGAVLDFARRERLGTVVFKDFTDRDLAPLHTALRHFGFFRVPSMPDTELRLERGSFEDYLAALPAKPRRNARSKIRKFEALPGLRTEVVHDFSHLLPEMLTLYRQVMDRADQTLDVLDAPFFAAVHESTTLDRRLVACFEGERLVAFLLCFFAGSGAVGARIGLDYRLAHDARLYHTVHYAAIRLALAEGCHHIRFAQTAYEPKTELGCELIEQAYAVTHLSPLPRAVLRRLLPPALAAATARALGSHAPVRGAEGSPRSHDDGRPPHATR
ncbi:GNAT family N-acetyltransferase [Streptomyces sp. NPDC088725]|uniref:GNAT family N-acetyltransferase n=1 Tax=Streptomyces sp. NPDC088725 TaxID=3365873 RepID=UPI003800262C